MIKESDRTRLKTCTYTILIGSDGEYRVRDGRLPSQIFYFVHRAALVPARDQN